MRQIKSNGDGVCTLKTQTLTTTQLVYGLDGIYNRESLRSQMAMGS